MNIKLKLLRTIISVSSIVVLAKILGFAKQMITANAFGATKETDLISISEGLISNIDYVLIQAVSMAFVPIYINIKSNNPSNCKTFVSNVVKVFFFITLVIAYFVFVGNRLIAKILAPSYSVELASQLANYVRIFAPTVIILIESTIFNALLKANESFVSSELIGVNKSVILIALVLLIGNRLGPDTLVLGFYLYAIFNFIFLMMFSRRYWSLEFGNPFVDPNVHKMFSMMVTLVLGYSVVFVNQQVDKIIVSGLGEGTITAMGYAAVLSNFICTFIGSICGVLFTYITKNVAERKDEVVTALVFGSLMQMVTLLIPISILTLMNSHDIVMIVFGRGKFDSNAVRSCSSALMGYGCLFIPYALREIFSRFQYAYGDSKRPMINSVISIVLNVILSIILSLWFGVLGVTLATSISVFICGILNIISSCKKNESLIIYKIIKIIPQWVVGIAICLIISIVGQNMLSEIHFFIRFLIITIVTMVFYYLVNYSIVKSLVGIMLDK